MTFFVTFLLAIGMSADLMANASPAAQKSHSVQLEVRPGDRVPGDGLTEMNIPGYGGTVYIGNEVVLSNADMATAEATTQRGENAVNIALTENSKMKLAELTKKQLNKVVGIFLNGRLISAPVIRAQLLGGHITVLGNLSDEDVKNIVATFAEE